jgi:hypothetical protein
MQVASDFMSFSNGTLERLPIDDEPSRAFQQTGHTMRSMDLIVGPGAARSCQHAWRRMTRSCVAVFVKRPSQ